jgi:hypothetical protein
LVVPQDDRVSASGVPDKYFHLIFSAGVPFNRFQARFDEIHPVLVQNDYGSQTDGIVLGRGVFIGIVSELLIEIPTQGYHQPSHTPHPKFAEGRVDKKPVFEGNIHIDKDIHQPGAAAFKDTGQCGCRLSPMMG